MLTAEANVPRSISATHMRINREETMSDPAAGVQPAQITLAGPPKLAHEWMANA